MMCRKFLRTVLRFPAHAGQLGQFLAMSIFCACGTISGSLGIIPARVGQLLAMLEKCMHVWDNF